MDWAGSNHRRDFNGAYLGDFMKEPWELTDAELEKLAQQINAEEELFGPMVDRCYQILKEHGLVPIEINAARARLPNPAGASGRRPGSQAYDIIRGLDRDDQEEYGQNSPKNPLQP